ncbi:MAG: ATP-binding protein [Bacillota bacterium]
MVTPAEVEVRDLARRARASLEQRRGQLLQLKADLERLKGELAERQRYRELCTQVAALLRTAAEQARRDAREQVELLVTDALRYVFGPHLEFQVVTQERAGRSEAEFYVVSSFGSQRVQNRPQDARGGGVVDVVSLALRAALLLLARPPLEGPIVLDEPAKHVSEEYIARVASFLKETSSSFGRQVIMVTHNQHLAHTGDRAYLVEMKDGVSRAREVAVSLT